jgi:hypothetical protein
LKFSIPVDYNDKLYLSNFKLYTCSHICECVHVYVIALQNLNGIEDQTTRDRNLKFYFVMSHNSLYIWYIRALFVEHLNELVSINIYISLMQKICLRQSQV